MKELPKFISVHLPKCCGTTFLEMLKLVYGDKLLHQTSMKRHPEAENHHVIHGHFPITLYQDLDRPAITFVRDPVERVISQYYYWLSIPDMANPECKAMCDEKWTIEQFAERTEANLQTRLAGTDINQYAFVGICEVFDRDIERLEKKLGITFPRIERKNVSKFKFKVSNETREMIRELNDVDAEFYLDAKARCIGWWLWYHEPTGVMLEKMSRRGGRL